MFTTKIRNAAMLFQLGFLVLLLACRVIASVEDAALGPKLQSDQVMAAPAGAHRG